MPADPTVIITAITEGAKLIERIVDLVRRAREAGDIETIRRVSDVLDREELRSREMLDEAEERVRRAGTDAP